MSVNALAPERVRDWGLFIISLSALMYEILITRILSVVMYYNFVSLVVVLVLFGTSMGSLAVHFFPEHFPLNLQERYHRRVNAFAMGVFGTYIFLLGFRFMPDLFGQMIELFKPQIATMPGADGTVEVISRTPALILAAIFYPLLTIPYFWVGVYTTTRFKSAPKEVARSYIFDLVGAGVGCLLIIPVIDYFGAPSALLCIVVLAVGASAVAYRQLLPGATVVAIVSVLLILLNSAIPFSEIDFVHGNYDSEVKYTKWNSYSRVVVYPLEPTLAESEGRSGRPPEKMGLAINETGYTALLQYGPGSRHEYLKDDITTLAYQLLDKPEVLLIGPGGGQDIIAARHFEPKRVVAVEINRAIVETVDEQFGYYTGKPYSMPGVETVIDNARSYIQRSQDSYDLIAASLVYEWFHPSAGAFSLSESSLYTIEAFEQYFTHLKPDGLLSFSRFGFETRSLRLVVLAVAALERLGVKNPEQCIFIADSGGFSTFLFRKRPFAPAELELLFKHSMEQEFTILYQPGTVHDNAFDRYLTSADRAQVVAGYGEDISPPTDDRPFFNYLLRPQQFWNLSAENPQASYNEKTVSTLRWFSIACVGLIAVMLLFPLARWAVSGSAARPSSLPRLGAVCYFALIGLGFMVFEIVLLRIFSVFLGHPVYSLSVTLFSLLLFCGLGSGLWQRYLAGRVPTFGPPLVIAGFIGCFYLMHDLLFPTFGAGILPLRMLIVVLIMLPVSLVLGMAFPAGIARFAACDPDTIPWIWATNGAASIAGSMIAFLLAINYGFENTLLLAAGIYLLAALMALTRAPEPSAS